MAAVRFALLEIAVDAAHLIGHVSKAQHGLLPASGEGVERCGLHFDSKRALCARGSNGARRVDACGLLGESRRPQRDRAVRSALRDGKVLETATVGFD